MSETMRPVVLSVAAFVNFEAIDGGDTVVLRFMAPDGRDIVLLVPRLAISELVSCAYQVVSKNGASVP